MLYLSIGMTELRAFQRLPCIFYEKIIHVKEHANRIHIFVAAREIQFKIKKNPNSLRVIYAGEQEPIYVKSWYIRAFVNSVTPETIFIQIYKLDRRKHHVERSIRNEALVFSETLFELECLL